MSAGVPCAEETKRPCSAFTCTVDATALPELGRIGVEDVSALLSDILAREFESGELFEDHHDDEDEKARAKEVIDTIRTEGAAVVGAAVGEVTGGKTETK